MANILIKLYAVNHGPIYISPLQIQCARPCGPDNDHTEIIMIGGQNYILDHKIENVLKELTKRTYVTIREEFTP